MEFDAFGVPMKNRAGRAREFYEIVTRLLLGERVAFDGKHFRLSDVQLGMVRPTALPRPPVWATAHGGAGIARAAEFGDAWFISHQPTVEELQPQVSLYQELKAKRPFAANHAFESHGVHLPILREAFVLESAEEAVQLARLPMMENVQSYVETGQLAALGDPEGYVTPFDEWRKGRALIGDPESVLGDCERLRDDLGVDCIVLKINKGDIPMERVLHSIALVGRHIVSALN